MQVRFVPYLLGILCALACSPAAGAETRELTLPQPDGRYAVGTLQRDFIDRTRHRELETTFWYPAERKGAAARYMDRVTGKAAAEYWDLQPDFAEHVHVHAATNVAFAEGGPRPVVLLEHGSGVVPAIYSTLAEGLASKGFVVVAINHPSVSLICDYPDGRIVQFAPYWPEKADRKTQGRATTQLVVSVLAPDVRFALDELARRNASDSFLRGRLDLGHVGVVGHSLGATAAMIATQQDRRIRAAVNLDGSTFPGMASPFVISVPLLFLMTQEHATGPTHGREFHGTKSDTYYVVVKDAQHLSFTDSHMLMSVFFRNPASDHDELGRSTRIAVLTRSLVAKFLDKYLRAARAPLSDSAVSTDRQ